MAEKTTLVTLDYVTLCLILFLSCFMGFYHIFTSKRYKAREFLMKNPKLNVLSLVLSIMASASSAAGFLGVPRETYMNGVIFGQAAVSNLFFLPFGVWLYLPLIFNLGYSSLFQYFEERYNKIVRRSASLLFTVCMIIKTSIEIFVPSLILNQVTGIHIWIFVAVTGFVCCIYTSLGGLKAVIWADAVQAVVMLTTILFTIIIGIMNVGGFSEMWQRNEDGHRTDLFIWTSSPYSQFTTWTFYIANTVGSFQFFATNQMFVQRYMSNQTLKNSQITFAGGVIASSVFHALLTALGLTVFAQFYDCDPLLSGDISYRDQTAVLMALRVLSGFQGLTGVFLASILCASLSTVSSTLNSTVAIIVEDLIIPFKPNISDKMLLKTSKILTVLLGLFAVLFVVLIQSIDNIFKTLIVAASNTIVPMCFMFFCGMMLPWVKTTSAVIGMLFGMVFVTWISVGNMLFTKPVHAPLSTEGCSLNLTFSNTSFTSTTVGSHNNTMNASMESDLQELYSTPYFWYPTYCVAVGTVATLISTLIFGAQSPDDVNPKLIFPFVYSICRKMPRRIQKILLFKTISIDQKESNAMSLHPLSTGDNVN